ncbi:uncharacterized protein BXZ73DRAFT_107903 [Epithele typhae]|uniref:uncharacterized protein n=1 Tax=Epithele typhae TaxID=378194 RepID=UPI002007FB11|nr:uncharacterized protein BXZ73DRAFT_107903 [Epithele typhae]KAH9911564.1 hypothetical protein BXZ73DRAFT_107903 [Epithele typhae]
MGPTFHTWLPVALSLVPTDTLPADVDVSSIVDLGATTARLTSEVESVVDTSTYSVPVRPGHAHKDDPVPPFPPSTFLLRHIKTFRYTPFTYREGREPISASVTALHLPLENAPLHEMSLIDWPRLHELVFEGEHPACMPLLCHLRFHVADVFDHPINTALLRIEPPPPVWPVFFPSMELAPLQALEALTSNLTQSGLTGVPGSSHPGPYAASLVVPGLLHLTVLEIEYAADDDEQDLLKAVTTTFPALQNLTLIIFGHTFERSSSTGLSVDHERRVADFLAITLRSMPRLNAVIVDIPNIFPKGMDGEKIGVPPRVIESILRIPQLRHFEVIGSLYHPYDPPYWGCPTIIATLTTFKSKPLPLRQDSRSNEREATLLRLLVPQLRSRIRVLHLPMEAVPFSELSQHNWPCLRELVIEGMFPEIAANTLSVYAPAISISDPPHSRVQDPCYVARRYSPSSPPTASRCVRDRHNPSRVGKKAQGAIIAGPRWFEEAQKDALEKAASDAGLVVLQLLEEAGAADVTTTSSTPTADLSADRTQLVGLAFPLATLRDDTIGGEEIDNKLIENFAKEFTKKTKTTLAVCPASDAQEKRAPEAKLRLALEHTKRTISASPGAATCSVESLKDGLYFTGTITRLRFDMEVRTIYDRVYAKVKELVATGLDLYDVDEVVCVGGSASLPGLDEVIVAELQEAVVAPFTQGTVVEGGVGDPMTILACGRANVDAPVREAQFASRYYN